MVKGGGCHWQPDFGNQMLPTRCWQHRVGEKVLTKMLLANLLATTMPVANLSASKIYRRIEQFIGIFALPQLLSKGLLAEQLSQGGERLQVSFGSFSWHQ